TGWPTKGVEGLAFAHPEKLVPAAEPTFTRRPASCQEMSGAQFAPKTPTSTVYAPLPAGVQSVENVWVCPVPKFCPEKNPWCTLLPDASCTSMSTIASATEAPESVTLAMNWLPCPTAPVALPVTATW